MTSVPATDPGPAPADPAGRAPLVPVLALATTLGVGAFALLAALVAAVTTPLTLPAGIGGGEQNQSAESAVYLLSLGVLLPAAVLAVPRLADRIARGPNATVLVPLAGLLAASLAGMLLLARIGGEVGSLGGIATVGVVAGLWAVFAGATLWRASRPTPWGRALSVAGRPAAGRGAWAAAAALTFVLVGSLTNTEVLSEPVLVALMLAISPVLAASSRGRLPRPGKRLGRALDVAVLMVILLAVPDLVIFVASTGGSPLDFDTEVMRFHQNFLLGPANEVLAGGAVLVDTASQYGIGSIYLTAGWSAMAGIGYGTFGLLDGILTALVFAGGWCVLRMAGVSRLAAAVTMALAVAALAYALVYPIGGLPQQGPLRFGLPMAVVIAATFAAWRPGRARLGLVVQLGALGLSSIWGFESFAYTAATFTALSALEILHRTGAGRRRELALRAAGAAAACMAAHVILALATLAFRGELPDWGQYLAYLDAFLFGPLGDLTYDIEPWSPGFAVGCGYFVSAAAVVLVVRRAPGLVAGNRVALVALTGLSAYGLVLFSYFVDRSTAIVLPYVCLPLLLAGAIWLRLINTAAPARGGGRLLANALALSLAALAGAAAAPSVIDRLESAPLGQVLPGGPSPAKSLDRLFDPPPLDPLVEPAETLLARSQPGTGRTATIISPDLQTEVLMRAGRGTRLGSAYPWGDSFAAGERLPGIRDAIAGLRAGDPLMLDVAALRAYRQLRRQPGRNAVANPTTLGALAPVQEEALQELGRRFSLREVDREGSFIAMRLVPLRP